MSLFLSTLENAGAVVFACIFSYSVLLFGIGAAPACGQAPSSGRSAFGDSTRGKAPRQLPSRAERWRQKRRAKAETLSDPEPGFFDRVSQFIAGTGGTVVPRRLILDVPQLELAGFHPVFGGLGNGAGLTGGLLYEPTYFSGERRMASLELLGSVRKYYGAEVLFGIESDRYVGYSFLRYQHRPSQEFYGVGPESERSDESVFRLDEGTFGVLFGRSLSDRILLGGHVSYQLNRYGRGRGKEPQVSDQFGTDLPGVGTDLDYLAVGGYFELDARDVPYRRAFGHRFAPTERRLRSVSLNASRGFYLAGQITHNVDLRLHDFDFTRFTLDMREFLPIDKNLLHGFAFRQFASVTRSSDGRVPFYRLQTIGGSRSLRGYSGGRFRDRNVLLLNAEVRCQVWHWLDMAVFSDVGQVFRNIDAVGRTHPRIGYGIGFRLKTDDQILGRIDIARSEAGITTHLDIGSLF